MRKIKREDEVIVLTGKDKGKRGKVQKVLDESRVLVSGINMIKAPAPQSSTGRCRRYRRERGAHPGV